MGPFLEEEIGFGYGFSGLHLSDRTQHERV